MSCNWTKGYGVFFYKKKTKKIYGAKLIFWSFATFVGLTIFWSGDKQRFCFREIYWFINQSGIPYLSIVHIMASRNFIRLPTFHFDCKEISWVWFALRYERILWSFWDSRSFLCFYGRQRCNYLQGWATYMQKIRTLLHSRRM